MRGLSHRVATRTAFARKLVHDTLERHERALGEVESREIPACCGVDVSEELTAQGFAEDRIANQQRSALVAFRHEVD